jgi:hypothetical protein
LYYLYPPSKLRLNESIGIRASRFSYSYVVGTHTTTYYAYLNFQNKNIKSFECKYQVCCFDTLLFFVDIGKNLIIVDDATKSLTLSIVLIQNEELEETLFDVNVSQ